MFSPKKRKRKSEGGSTPMKRVREKLDGGVLFETESEWILPCRALCDAVISVSAASTGEERESALKELEELVASPAKVGLKYNGPSPQATEAEKNEAKKLSGTPLYLAATLDCVDAAQILIEAGASLVAKFDGLSPLEAAVKHSSSQVLALFLERIKLLETPHSYENNNDDDHNSLPHTSRHGADRPPLRRGWTHTSPDGHREARIHRRNEENEPEHPSGHIASVLATSAGYEHAPAHESNPGHSTRSTARGSRRANA